MKPNMLICMSMKIEIEIDLTQETDRRKNDGQIAVKLPKEDEIRWLVLNKRYSKKLSESLRSAALALMAKVEAQEEAS